ncbi:MAG: four helix bundle protein [Chitinophagaceae bacterium]|nr:four helix bundle protein [Chitinophagaceae bacterium]
MAIQKFEDIIAWQKSQAFAVGIYAVFVHSKDFGFRDQICRAVVSVSNNIAEGFDRGSDADFSRFLYIAISSCSEVKSMLHLAEKLQYITTLQKESLLEKGDEISKIIRGLIKSLDGRKTKSLSKTVKGISDKAVCLLVLIGLIVTNFIYQLYPLQLYIHN